MDYRERVSYSVIIPNNCIYSFDCTILLEKPSKYISLEMKCCLRILTPPPPTPLHITNHTKYKMRFSTKKKIHKKIFLYTSLWLCYSRTFQKLSFPFPSFSCVWFFSGDIIEFSVSEFPGFKNIYTLIFFYFDVLPVRRTR